MAKNAYKILYIFLLLLLSSGCGWQNLPQGEQQGQTIIEVTMRAGGPLDSKLFYYIVFNFSQKPGNKPDSIFEGDKRGKYWNVYYMWGTPPLKTTQIYRGFGGVNQSGTNLLDNSPLQQEYLNELLPGTSVEGDHMTLRIDLTPFKISPTKNIILNMNMIVCNQAMDAESKTYYGQYLPYVFDSFYSNGISMNISTTTDFFNEQLYPQEPPLMPPNEHEDVAPANANIIDWTFQVISR
jgi:hypothetical protein